MLPITEELLQPGNPNTSWNHLHPQGLVIHETADPGATAQNESDFEHNQAPHTSAHYFVDDKQIIRNLPENVVAYHAGPTANDKFIGIELCHFDDPAQFEKVWQNAVDLAADVCYRLQLKPTVDIHSHAWVSETWHETDHTDPIEYFAKHGKNMDEFVAEVQAGYEKLLAEPIIKPEEPAKASDEEGIQTHVPVPFGYMSEGSQGHAVGELQAALNAAGVKPQLDVDYDFGPLTRKALIAFQKKVGIEPDGIYGPVTEGKLKEALA